MTTFLLIISILNKKNYFCENTQIKANSVADIFKKPYKIAIVLNSYKLPNNII